MPKAKSPTKAALIAQLQSISAQLDEGASALKDLETHLGNLNSLRKQVFSAIAGRNAKTADLLSNTAKSKDLALITTKLRAIEKSTSASMLKLQRSMQSEGDLITAIANILKKEREKIRDIISNVP